MANPWTHDNIEMMKEIVTDRECIIRPHPSFTTRLRKFQGQVLEYCIADDLFHMYPSILALGVILIEIATKQPSKPENSHYLWDETTINDYYEWAWTTEDGSNLGDIIGAAYEAVVNNCLDAELFRDGPTDPSRLDEDLEIRQSRLYEKVVLAKLKGVRGRERIETKLSGHLVVLQDKLGPRIAGYPGSDGDELFQSGYRHKHHGPTACQLCSACERGTDPVCEEARLLTCQRLGCQKWLLVPRKRLQEASANNCPPRPKIHFGLVGSGDTVMRSGQRRDETASQHSLIAFEMEASGVWEILPCLVIKGVCDYADSHKNKDWQHYAAATAASCMKAVLEECPISEW